MTFCYSISPLVKINSDWTELCISCVLNEHTPLCLKCRWISVSRGGGCTRAAETVEASPVQGIQQSQTYCSLQSLIPYSWVSRPAMYTCWGSSCCHGNTCFRMHCFLEHWRTFPRPRTQGELVLEWGERPHLTGRVYWSMFMWVSMWPVAMYSTYCT